MGQECVNPHSHLLELLLLLSQEVGHTWLRYLVCLFSQHEHQDSTELSTYRFGHPVVWLRLKPMIPGPWGLEEA